jgi:ABC-type glutathione transport system ATPase component
MRPKFSPVKPCVSALMRCPSSLSLARSSGWPHTSRHVEKQARTVDIEATLDIRLTRCRKLLVGYSADIEVILAVRDKVVRVPTSALQEGGKVLVALKMARCRSETSKPAWQTGNLPRCWRAGCKATSVVTSLEREGVKAGAAFVRQVEEMSPHAQNPLKNEMSPHNRAAGIERVFHLGDSEVHALRNLNLSIAAGEYVAVMGPSGSGKSTLLNLLGLLDRPNVGLYRLEGRDVTTLSPDEQARVRSQRIGFVFQSFHLVPRLSAAENIALPMVLAGLPRPSGRPGQTGAQGLRAGEPGRPPPR